MSTFAVEVYANALVHGVPAKTWQRLKPSRGPEYRFDTEDEAEQCARMCYPDHKNDVRIVKVEQ